MWEDLAVESVTRTCKDEASVEGAGVDFIQYGCEGPSRYLLLPDENGATGPQKSFLIYLPMDYPSAPPTVYFLGAGSAKI